MSLCWREANRPAPSGSRFGYAAIVPGLNRKRRVRLVLAVGALTAVATSAAEDFVRSAQARPELAPGQTQRVTVHATETAHLAAEDFEIAFDVWAPLRTDITVRVVPHDSRLPTHELRLRSGVASCTSCPRGPTRAQTAGAGAGEEDDASAAASDMDSGAEPGPASPVPSRSAQVTYTILHEHCPRSGGCELSFDLERSDGPSASDEPLAVGVDAQVRRGADGRLFCGENRDFKRGSALEISIDE